MIECDVLVVGAGPAGSMVAKTIAERNLNVIVVERNKEIGVPVRCAEGVNRYTFRDNKIKKDGSFVKQRIDGTVFYFYDEIYPQKTSHWRGYTIDRKIFDKYLAKNAEMCGAKVLTSCPAVGMKKQGDGWIVEIMSNGKSKSIKTKTVVGADGFDCNVGGWAGIRRPWRQSEYSKCYELELGGLNLKGYNYWHVAFSEEFRGGYFWIFPKGRDTANVGVSVEPRFDAVKALDFFLTEYPHFSKMIGEDYSILEIKGGCVPTCGPKSIDETISDGVILVGDAAGMVDALTSEGISSSMLSGISAGETIVRCISKGSWKKDDLKSYEKVWRKKRFMNTTLGEELDFGAEAKEEFYSAFNNRKLRENREMMMNEVKGR